MKQMKYVHQAATFPKRFELLPQVNSAAERLHQKLSQLNLQQSGISEYNQRQLTSKLANPIGSLQLYGHLLALSLAGNELPLEDFAFVDYGGGSGCLSLLAKQMGLGRVIYNDIYDVSCNDVKTLARATGLEIDDYVCGDIDELIGFLRQRSLSINAIGSYDVIEHIYDVESYMRRLRFLSDSPFRVVFGSGANIKNPLIRRKLRRIHWECEHKDREDKRGRKQRDTLKSYQSARKEIIGKHEPALPPEVIEEIAKATRGLMKQDIEKCVDEYVARGEISYRPNHPTNTCDPYTGNWAEHLMETEWIESILKEEGFEVRILRGYYPCSRTAYKRLMANALNVLMKHVERKALFLSPYYIVFADYRPPHAEATSTPI